MRSEKNDSIIEQGWIVKKNDKVLGELRSWKSL